MATVQAKVVYNANGGSGAPAGFARRFVSVSLPYFYNYTIASGTPTRSGYTFLGWSQSSSASTPTYTAGDTYRFGWYSDGVTETLTLYAVWQDPYTITYKPGTSGSGSQQTQSKPAGSSVKLKGAIFTRDHYTQVGWSRTDGGSQAYALGATYSADADITLYPVWKASNSIISSLSSSVDIGVNDGGSLTITRYNSNYVHRVEFTYGSRSYVEENVGTSLTFRIPGTWLADFPTSTTGVATCTVKTFEGSTLIGSPVSKTFTVNVPASAVPSVSLTAEYHSSNSTVDGWGILLQGYSTIKLTAAATAPGGTTIDTITFSGDGVSQTGSGTSVTSSVLKTYGSREWTCTVRDKRGRTTTVTHTATVFWYGKPSISSMTAERALSDGTESPAEGTYIKAKSTYSVAYCDGHNSATVKKIEYKAQTASSWSTGQSSAASGTAYTFGGGNIAILNNYDVRMTLTDAVGNSSTFIVTVSSVKGVSFGLNGECARFGGPVQNDDMFECDWDTVIHGDLAVDGKIGAVGTYTYSEPSSSSLTNNSWTAKANITLTKGTYIIYGGAAFGQNQTGRRQMVINQSQNADTTYQRGASSNVNATVGSTTTVSAVCMVTLAASATFYLNLYQNSGSSLTVYPWLRAMRIL